MSALATTHRFGELTDIEAMAGTKPSLHQGKPQLLKHAGCQIIAADVQSELFSFERRTPAERTRCCLRITLAPRIFNSLLKQAL
jgi:hypothetical protein